MGQAKNRLKEAMQETGKDPKAAQTFLIEQAKERNNELVQSVASDESIQSLMDEEVWDQIDSIDGFRHYVLSEQERSEYLGSFKETRDKRQLAWTGRPLQAKAFSTVDAADAMIQRINGDPDYRKVPLVIGALVETETQYVVVPKRDAV